MDIKKKVFSELDLKREKSHQKNFYPNENEYSPKTKITKYKKGKNREYRVCI